MTKWRRVSLTTVMPLTLLALTAVVLVTTPAGAQSPQPSWYSYDMTPSTGFPPDAPYTSAGANAVVVEGLGSLGCAGSNTSIGAIEFWTDAWIDGGYQTITEISPQAYCGTLAQYESLLSQIESNVETYATNPGRYWGGLMLDEEPGFDFTAASLETLNSYTEALMGPTPGVSWYYTEDQPNGWKLPKYNAIVGDSIPAPQAYTSDMVNSINSECSTYGMCLNDVTVDADAAWEWDYWAWVVGNVSGSPWSSGDWGTGYWWNEWQTSAA